MSSSEGKPTDYASTPMKRAPLPLASISAIRSTRSEKYRKKLAKSSTSSTSQRDSKESLLVKNADIITTRRRCTSRSWDGSAKRKRNEKRRERKRNVRRKIESSSETDWQTTREDTLPRDSAAKLSLGKSSRIDEGKYAQDREHRVVDDSEGDAIYPWERPPELVRDVPRVIDDVESIFERPLPRSLHLRAKKTSFVSGDIEDFAESADHLIVGTHEKHYPLKPQNLPLALDKRAWQESNFSYKSPVRHIRNHKLMLEIRNRDVDERKKPCGPASQRRTEGRKKSSDRKARKIGGGCDKGSRTRYVLSATVPSTSDRKTTTICGRCEKESKRWFLDSEDDDDEIWSFQGMRFLKIRPRTNFHYPGLSSPEFQINWETGECERVARPSKTAQATHDPEENLGLDVHIGSASGSTSRDQIFRKRSRIRPNNGGSDSSESQDGSSEQIFNESRRTVDRRKVPALRRKNERRSSGWKKISKNRRESSPERPSRNVEGPRRISIESLQVANRVSEKDSVTTVETNKKNKRSRDLDRKRSRMTDLLHFERSSSPEIAIPEKLTKRSYNEDKIDGTNLGSRDKNEEKKTYSDLEISDDDSDTTVSIENYEKIERSSVAGKSRSERPRIVSEKKLLHGIIEKRGPERWKFISSPSNLN